MKRIVILGGLGFVGKRLSRELALGTPYEVTVFDRPGAEPGELTKLPVHLIFGNYFSSNDVINVIHDKDIVISLVHTSVPQTSMERPIEEIYENLIPTVAWLSRLNETSVKRIMYFSSGGTVYGEQPYNTPITEMSQTNPVCAYGISKLYIEKQILMYSHIHKIKPIIIRPANIYGPNPYINRPQGIIGVVLSATLKGRTVYIFGKGNSVRDYIHIQDVCSAVSRLISYNGKHEVFNLGSGVGYCLNELCSIIEEILPFEREYVDERNGGIDVKWNVLDSTLLRSNVGWPGCKISIQDGIMEVIESLRE